MHNHVGADEDKKNKKTSACVCLLYVLSVSRRAYCKGA